jgi:hypothetical protein
MHTRRFVIKNSKFRISDLLYIGLFFSLINLFFQKDVISISLILLIAMTGLIVFKIMQRLNNNTEQIVIDENGITLNFNNTGLIEWKNIKFAYIKQKVVGTGKSTRVIDWFYIETAEEEFTVKMSDFSYDASSLAEYINHFSGREIGRISNKLKHNVSHLLKNKDFADEIELVFKTYFMQQKNIVYIWILLIVAAIILQSVMGLKFPYIFAIGWSITLLIGLITGINEEKKLYNHKSLINLDKETIKKLMDEYGKEFGHKSSTTATAIASYVFLGLITVIIFGFSYFYGLY